ncbi:MAG: acyl-CoA dehydratase activase [Eggerthellales bacterium]|nr:acyl-CoA dehydratase activase [Eggerthellales bacterium]
MAATYAQLYSDARISALMDAVNLSSEKKDEENRPYYRVGVGIGSITSKVAVLEGNKLVHYFIFPTGLNSSDAAKRCLQQLEADGYSREDCAFAATGIGQMAVNYAQKNVDIAICHGKGAHFLFSSDGIVIDIGGQETQIMEVSNGRVEKIASNDRCSAAVGKFLESTALRMGITVTKLEEIAHRGTPVALSSMCMVFVESELAKRMAQGASNEDLAWMAIESVANRVAPLIPLHKDATYMLTGGQCDNHLLVNRLSEKLGVEIKTSPLGRYAGVIGAALSLPAKRPVRQ